VDSAPRSNLGDSAAQNQLQALSSQLEMQIFSNRKAEPQAPPAAPPAPPAVSEQPIRSSQPRPSGGILSRGVSIEGSVKFDTELLIDGEVEGTIESTGTLTIGEHARIRGEITAASITVLGKVEGNILATERCELQAGSTLRGDIEAPRLVVDEAAAFQGSAKIAPQK
jgi:cytoskeletal protein CcmA (bactofilin family)